MSNQNNSQTPAQNTPKYFVKLKLKSGKKKEFLIESNEFELTEEFFQSRIKYKEPVAPADIEQVIKISRVEKGSYNKAYDGISQTKAILETPNTYDFNFTDSTALLNLIHLVEAMIKLLTKSRREIKKTI
ncbi:MAG: hypothetical protein PVH88_24405 [Ignavibacteria bacterium]|jgi:molecular chaperone DnaK (HSP70)